MNCEWRFFKSFKLQVVINLAPLSLSNKKVNFYTFPRLTFWKKNATENAYKSISEPLYFKIFQNFPGGGMPPNPPSGSRLWRSNLASSCSEVWLWPCSQFLRLLATASLIIKTYVLTLVVVKRQQKAK